MERLRDVLATTAPFLAAARSAGEGAGLAWGAPCKSELGAAAGGPEGLIGTGLGPRLLGAGLPLGLLLLVGFKGACLFDCQARAGRAAPYQLELGRPGRWSWITRACAAAIRLPRGSVAHR